LSYGRALHRGSLILPHGTARWKSPQFLRGASVRDPAGIEERLGLRVGDSIWMLWPGVYPQRALKGLFTGAARSISGKVTASISCMANMVCLRRQEGAAESSLSFVVRTHHAYEADPGGAAPSSLSSQPRCGWRKRGKRPRMHGLSAERRNGPARTPFASPARLDTPSFRCRGLQSASPVSFRAKVCQTRPSRASSPSAWCGPQVPDS